MRISWWLPETINQLAANLCSFDRWSSVEFIDRRALKHDGLVEKSNQKLFLVQQVLIHTLQFQYSVVGFILEWKRNRIEETKGLLVIKSWTFMHVSIFTIVSWQSIIRRYETKIKLPLDCSNLDEMRRCFRHFQIRNKWNNWLFWQIHQSIEFKYR